MAHMLSTGNVRELLPAAPRSSRTPDLGSEAFPSLVLPSFHRSPSSSRGPQVEGQVSSCVHVHTLVSLRC